MRFKFPILALLALAGGCVSVKNEQAIVPPSGLYSEFRAPLIVPKESVSCANLKVGTCTRSVYVKEWIYTGIDVDVVDMTLEQAMKNGGISHLAFADYDQYSIFGFVTLFTVTAYGR